MRILIVSPRYYPEVGAASVRISNMAAGLKERGHEVEVLTSMPFYPGNRILKGYRHRFAKKEVVEGVHIYRYWCHADNSKNTLGRVCAMFSFAMTLWAFAFHFRRIRRYDRVIIQTPALVTAASAMLLFHGLFRKHVVLNVSDLWPLSAVALGAMRNGSLSYRYMARLERRLYRQADAVVGQSEEILTHVYRSVPTTPMFLYRNVQPSDGTVSASTVRHQPLRIIYAGLLGLAQDLMGIVNHVSFRSLGAELHLYGGGAQADEIERYVSKGTDDVVFHGSLPKDQMNAELCHYDLSLVPLVTSIYGAVPSKLFDILPAGVPLLFCGDGEGAAIVRNESLGLTCAPNDYQALAANIRTFTTMSEEEYAGYVKRCVRTAGDEFSFARQMDRFCRFLAELQ